MGPKAPLDLVRESPRVAIPSAVVRVLSALIDELSELPSSTRVELRSIRTRICLLYRLPDPASRANASELAQQMAEYDGEEIDDTDVSP